MYQETHTASLSSDDAYAATPAEVQPTSGERMSLSLLRRRVRAGWYEDDLHSQTGLRLLFLRWLVREGLLSEWSEAEE
ncbi:MAG TPA: hypothetical protein VKT82_26560 [Ktedonobacterales bacterium]|nr:hypothetical protein [Ktedonobacterales bacterium]